MQLKKIYNFSLIQLIVLTAIAIGVGVIVTVLVTNKTNSRLKEFIDATHPVRVNNSQYKFIKALLAYDQPESSEFKEYKPLEDLLNKTIADKTANSSVQLISVYYRNLNNGHWVGINENESYDPASLMKVPLMIAYLKQSEGDVGLLDKQLTFKKELNISAKIPFIDPTKLVDGTNYTIKDLLKYMIKDSDNGAMDLLLGTVDQNALAETYSDLGIPDPNLTHGNYNISPKTYSFFFRVLYNSTYLNLIDSEFALSLLGEATFNDGLVAGLPNNTQIAHKFGEHIQVNSDGTAGTIELHDCGIVYKQNSPYVICVMTKGTKLEDLKTTLSDISKLVYDRQTIPN